MYIGFKIFSLFIQQMNVELTNKTNRSAKILSYFPFQYDIRESSTYYIKFMYVMCSFMYILLSSFFFMFNSACFSPSNGYFLSVNGCSSYAASINPFDLSVVLMIQMVCNPIVFTFLSMLY